MIYRRDSPHSLPGAAAILMILCGTALAQGVAITSPAHGAGLEITSPYYIGAREEVHVTGAVSGIAAVALGDYRVLVQGMNAPLLVAGATITFQMDVPVGPGPPIKFGGIWLSWYPYLSAYTDYSHLHKPILAELFQISTNKVLDRDRIVLFDKRPDPNMQHQFTGSSVGNALGFEMTYTGLDELERTHRSTLPQPGRAAFNALLRTKFANFPQEYSPDTSIFTSASDRACIPLDQADPAFQNTTAYQSAATQARLQRLAYQQAQNNPAAPANAAILLAACVRTRVDPSDFEVCVGTIEGNSSDLRLEAVSRTDLELDNTNPIQAKVFLGRLDGRVNGLLRDLFIRYRLNPLFPCLPPLLPLRPQAQIDNTTVATTPELAAWTSCSNLGLSAPAPFTPAWLNFTFNPDAANRERNLIQSALPMPLFNLGPNIEEDPDHGQCADAHLRSHVETLLTQYYDHMRTSLNESWGNGHPNTQQALALDKLFSRWEVGVFGDVNLTDHKLKLEYSGTGVLPANRLFARTSSEVNSTTAAQVVPPPANWVYSSPGPFPCLDINNPCVLGRNHFLQPFDVSYSVTTGALNQVLKELSSTRALRFEVRPTYDDLSILPPPGVQRTDRPVLDGTLLQKFFGPFAELGLTTVQIFTQPTLMPFTWINPDPPPPIPLGRAPLTYQMSQYYVDFIGDTPGPNGSTLWLRVLVDFYDEDFQLSLHSVPARNLLVPALSAGAGQTYTILESQFVSCPVGPMTIAAVPPALPYPTCGADMATKVSELVNAMLNTRLLGMLSRYPAPLLYDADGAAAAPKRVTQIDKYQGQQVITFYGNLP